jgi:hypothetical protein
MRNYTNKRLKFIKIQLFKQSSILQSQVYFTLNFNSSREEEFCNIQFMLKAPIGIKIANH